MRPLAKFIGPYWLYAAAGLTCLILVTIAQLFVPRYLGVTVDRIIETKSLGVLNRAALVIFLAFALRSLLLYGQISFGFIVSHRVVADLRQRLIEHVHRWSLDRFARWTSGELIARSLQDTQVVQTNLLVGALDFLGTILTLTGTVAMLFVLQWQLALFTLIVIPILLGAARGFGHEIQRFSQRAQQGIADLASLIRQAFGAAPIIRAFVQEDREIARFRQFNERTLRANLRISQLIAAQVPIVSFLTTLGLVAVLWQGGRLVTGGAITAGALVAFLAYAGLAVEPAVTLSRQYGLMRQGLGALERVFEIIRSPEGVGDAAGARELPPIRGEVRFRDLSFTYDGSIYALNHISLDVSPGERIALVGPSGAGKTTLINMIPRFHDPTSGRVEIDGCDLRAVTLRSLRRQIGLVPQETVLFRGTVKENIAYARPDAAEAEIVAAARVANAHEFVVALPEGYYTVLGEEGTQLSGGQRQRLAIARAVLNAPRIIILDEATSALDPESERLIQEALDRLMEGRTTFIIAHRLSTVRKADRIIVLDASRIVEQGRHDELMALGGVYARLAGLQLVETTVTSDS